MYDPHDPVWRPFHRAVYAYGKQCAEEVDTELSDDMIPPYRERFFEYYGGYTWVPSDLKGAFDDLFWTGWVLFRYLNGDR